MLLGKKKIKNSKMLKTKIRKFDKLNMFIIIRSSNI